MTPVRVLVLGAGGMLGSMVAAALGAREELDVVATRRDGERAFDAGRDDVAALLDEVEPAWVVNAIGILSSRIDPADEASVQRAHDVNAHFPLRLAAAAAARGARVVHPATDGVFSGRQGPYDEAAPHDAADVYGRSKSAGEAPGEHVVNLRCSIVGPEPGGVAGGRAALAPAAGAPPRSLLEWLLAQPRGARVPGYADQRWNGITTLHFARLCAAIVLATQPPSGTVHVVPADAVTKAELLALLARAYGRDDLTIVPGASPAPADRTLTTLDPERNAALWRAAGYGAPPTIDTMVNELARTRL